MNPEVIDFIVNHVESIEQLEVLLLLRENKGREWSATDVNDVIRSSENSIVRHLQKWLSLGILRKKEGTSGIYFYSPSSPELQTNIDLLALYYRDRRTMVIEYIYSKALHGIRNFSDAFRFKKEDK